MPSYYPVFLDIRDRNCLVFGGNNEGERKVRYLLECGGQVSLFSPAGQITSGLEALANDNQITWHRRGYRPGDLEQAWLVIVADTSDPSVNKAVSDEASARNVVLNVMDVTHLCTFIAPAIVQRGNVTAAISTAATSPALARRLRERISDESYCRCMSWADLGPLLAKVRQDVRSRNLSVTPDHWAESITDDLLRMFRSGDEEGARIKLTNSLEVKAAD